MRDYDRSFPAATLLLPLHYTGYRVRTINHIVAAVDCNNQVAYTNSARKLLLPFIDNEVAAALFPHR
ncbi:hypothetical protein BOSP111201_07905 [Bordetella sputigena]